VLIQFSGRLGHGLIAPKSMISGILIAPEQPDTPALAFKFGCLLPQRIGLQETERAAGPSSVRWLRQQH
jgi:hypothetical protein